MTTRRWQYYLHGDAFDRDRLDERADEGETRLLRRPLGAEVGAQVLARSGHWEDTAAFAEQKYRGGWDEAVEIDQARAEQLIRHWAEIGRIASVPDFESAVPADLAAELADIDERHAARGRLLLGQPLDEAQVDQVRATVLSGTADFADDWLADGDKVVVAFEPPLGMYDIGVAARVADAYRVAHATVAWAVACEPWPDGDRPRGLPEGLAVDLDAQSMRAFDDLAYLVDMVVTTPDTACAILLGTGDYGLVGGPTEFVELVLDTSVTAARREFAAYAAGLTEPYDEVQLRTIVSKYVTRTQRP